MTTQLQTTLKTFIKAKKISDKIKLANTITTRFEKELSFTEKTYFQNYFNFFSKNS